MLYLESFAVIFTLVCVWLAAKRHVLSWPIGIIAVIFYGFIFWDAKLYADFSLQIIFLIQGVIGWILWSNNKDDNNVIIERLSLLEIIKWIFVSIWLTLFVNDLLNNYTDSSLPLLDAFLSVNSLIANWLLSKRKIDNWYMWIGLDIIYVGLFIYKELYISAGLYLVLGIMAFLGLKKWLKYIKE